MIQILLVSICRICIKLYLRHLSLFLHHRHQLSHKIKKITLPLINYRILNSRVHSVLTLMQIKIKITAQILRIPIKQTRQSISNLQMMSLRGLIISFSTSPFLFIHVHEVRRSFLILVILLVQIQQGHITTTTTREAKTPRIQRRIIA